MQPPALISLKSVPAALPNENSQNSQFSNEAANKNIINLTVISEKAPGASSTGPGK